MTFLGSGLKGLPFEEQVTYPLICGSLNVLPGTWRCHVVCFICLLHLYFHFIFLRTYSHFVLLLRLPALARRPWCCVGLALLVMMDQESFGMIMTLHGGVLYMVSAPYGMRIHDTALRCEDSCDWSGDANH